eukprot:1146645-Pelagomonas_calceolata.AAC.2
MYVQSTKGSTAGIEKLPGTPSQSSNVGVGVGAQRAAAFCALFSTVATAPEEDGVRNDYILYGLWASGCLPHQPPCCNNTPNWVKQRASFTRAQLLPPLCIDTPGWVEQRVSGTCASAATCPPPVCPTIDSGARVLSARAQLLTAQGRCLKQHSPHTQTTAIITLSWLNPFLQLICFSAPKTSPCTPRSGPVDQGALATIQPNSPTSVGMEIIRGCSLPTVDTEIRERPGGA